MSVSEQLMRLSMHLYELKTVSPNLPVNKAVHIAISEEEQEGIDVLKKSGYIPLIIKRNNQLPKQLASHPDLNIINYADTLYCLNKIYDKEINSIYNIKIIDKPAGKIYPHDVLLNSVIIGKRIICNKNTVSKELLTRCEQDEFEILDCKQGYTKCSTCVIDENSIITDDASVYKSAITAIQNVLLISKGSIRLKGYNYGFIGGCTGKLSNNLIAFNGRIDSHTDHNRIYDFLDKLRINAFEIKNDRLTDIGSIIPLTESIY